MAVNQTKETYQLKLEKNHLICVLNGLRFLIDTGSPFSVGKSGGVDISGKHYSLSEEFMGVKAGVLGDLAGIHLDGLIGVDILNEWSIEIDCQNGSITFGQDKCPNTNDAIPLSFCMGVPSVLVDFPNGLSSRMFFDTGAQYAYVAEDCGILHGAPELSQEEDFYPGIGKFDVQLYGLCVNLNGREWVVKCGILPKSVQDMLTLTDSKGILGNEVMHKSKIGYYPKESKLTID